MVEIDTGNGLPPHVRRDFLIGPVMSGTATKVSLLGNSLRGP